MGMILRIASSRIVGVRGYERMCTRKKNVERLSCGFEDSINSSAIKSLACH